MADFKAWSHSVRKANSLHCAFIFEKANALRIHIVENKARA